MADSTLYANDSLSSKREDKQVATWQERVNLGKQENERWAEDSGANRFHKEYEGKYDLVFHLRAKQIDVPPINEVFAYCQSDIASTYNRDPYMTVVPRGGGSVLGAYLREVWLNYEWRELKIKEEMELELLDKNLGGYAFHKVGMAIDSYGTDEQLKIENETLYSRRVDWRDVFWNLGSRRPPYDCMWMSQRFIMPLDDMKQKYPAAAKLTGSVPPNMNKDIYNKLMFKDDIKVGIGHEIWDARSKQIFTLAEDLTDRFLAPPRPWPAYLDEFPFLMYWDFAIPGKPRPMSAIAPWEAQIQEEIILLAQAVNHAKRWNRQLFIRGGSVDENSLDKYERGDDGAVIVVNGNLDDSSFKFADFGQLPTDFYLLMDRLKAIKREIHGQPEFERGGVTKTGTRTEGELLMIQQGAKGRTDRKIDRLETHLENIARHMMAHMSANFDFEKMVKVTGETPDHVIQALGDKFDPVTRTVRFTEDDIKGEYDIEIKAGSTLPLDKSHRVQVLETVLQTVAQVATQGPMSPFLNELVQEILRDFELKGLQKAYELEQQNAQQNAQQAAQNQQVDQGKTAAETAKRAAQAQQIQTETQIMAGHEAERQVTGPSISQIMTPPSNGQ